MCQVRLFGQLGVHPDFITGVELLGRGGRFCVHRVVQFTADIHRFQRNAVRKLGVDLLINLTADFLLDLPVGGSILHKWIGSTSNQRAEDDEAAEEGSPKSRSAGFARGCENIERGFPHLTAPEAAEKSGAAASGRMDGRGTPAAECRQAQRVMPMVKVPMRRAEGVFFGWVCGDESFADRSFLFFIFGIFRIIVLI